MLRAAHKAPGSPSQMYKLGYREFTSPRKTPHLSLGARSPGADVCLGINDGASGGRAGQEHTALISSNILVGSSSLGWRHGPAFPGSWGFVRAAREMQRCVCFECVWVCTLWHLLLPLRAEEKPRFPCSPATFICCAQLLSSAWAYCARISLDLEHCLCNSFCHGSHWTHVPPLHVHWNVCKYRQKEDGYQHRQSQPPCFPLRNTANS